MAKMFLMCGHPGSGKSTYARELARKNGFRYLSIDDMYATFNGDPTSHDNKFDVWMTFFRQIHAAEVAGQDVVVDTNAPTYCDRAEFLNWFSDFEHHLIWIDARQKLCLENNKKRSRVIPKEQMRKLFMLLWIQDSRYSDHHVEQYNYHVICPICGWRNLFEYFDKGKTWEDVPFDQTDVETFY